MRKAYELAQNSPDLSTQNGAIIVKGFEVIGEGYNRFPLGVKYSPERLARPAKYAWTEHAERASIFSAAKRGNSTYGAVMYCGWAACADCGRAIIEAGITELITHDTAIHHQQPNWQESIETALQMFKEAGVRVSSIDDVLDIRIRFGGEMVTV